MRHGKKVNHLGRTSSHRKAMLSNMAASLIVSKRITTTVAKAKALRKYVEPLITKAKKDETHSRREVFSYLQNKVAVTELFREVAAKVGDRPGGYTRILRTGFRLGDAAEMCMIELVDFNENYTQNKGNKKKAKTTRRGRGGAKKIDAPTVEQHHEEVVKEPIAETVVEKNVAAEVVEVEEVIPEIIDVQPEEIAGETEEKAEVEAAEVVEEPVAEAPAEEEK